MSDYISVLIFNIYIYIYVCMYIKFDYKFDFRNPVIRLIEFYVALWMPYFVSGSYIQYISISLLNYPHMHFWKWNKDEEVWQSDVIVLHWSSILSNQGIEANWQRKETASLCYPTGSIHILLTQEWMTTVNNSKVCPFSSLTICQEYCGHDASWRAEAEMDPQQGFYCALMSETQDQGPHL